MQLVKQNEAVIESRQHAGVSLVIRRTEYSMRAEHNGSQLGIMVMYVIGQDLPVRHEIEAFEDLTRAQGVLNRLGNSLPLGLRFGSAG